MSNSGKQASTLLAVMPEGIGVLTFGSEEWVSVANEEMVLAVNKHKNGLSDLGEFVFCEVAFEVEVETLVLTLVELETLLFVAVEVFIFVF